MNTEVAEIIDYVDGEKTVMTISSFSNIHLKLKYLTGIMRTKDESDTRAVDIECYKRPMLIDNSKIESVIRFSIDSEVWFEINTMKRIGGDILPKCIAVNLYDIFNMVDNCRDEMISMWIDDESNELVLNSYYNEELDRDELEVRLPVIHCWEAQILNVAERPEPRQLILLSPITTYSALKELNIENKTNHIQFLFIDGKLSLASEYNGILAKIEPKEFANDDYGLTKSFSVPFGLFYLMSSTGQIDPLRLEIHDGYVYLETSDYGFKYYVDPDDSLVDVSEFNADGAEKIFVIDSEEGFAAIEKVTNLNCATEFTEITYEKISNGVADLCATIDSRMKIYVTAILATISDIKVSFDGAVFRDLFSKNGVDAIAVNRLPDGRLYVSYGTAAVHKTIVYDHDTFMEFRKSHV